MRGMNINTGGHIEVDPITHKGTITAGLSKVKAG
jgi:hypothetical protein